MSDFKKGGGGNRGGFRNKGGNSGGRPSFGGGNRFGGNGGGFKGRRDNDRSSAPSEMFSATCAQCHKQCEGPFRPNGEKPGYCRDCFRKPEMVPGRNSNGADGSMPMRNNFQRDQRPEAEFRPRSEYRAPESKHSYSPDGFASLQRQIVTLESKVNRILELVSKKPAAPEAQPASNGAKAQAVASAPKASLPKVEVKAKAPGAKKAKVVAKAPAKKAAKKTK